MDKNPQDYIKICKPMLKIQQKGKLISLFLQYFPLILVYS